MWLPHLKELNSVNICVVDILKCSTEPMSFIQWDTQNKNMPHTCWTQASSILCTNKRKRWKKYIGTGTERQTGSVREKRKKYSLSFSSLWSFQLTERMQTNLNRFCRLFSFWLICVALIFNLMRITSGFYFFFLLLRRPHRSQVGLWKQQNKKEAICCINKCHHNKMYRFILFVTR